MSLGANFTYGFLINYLLFSLIGHSFLLKARQQVRSLLIASIFFLAVSTLSLSLLVLFSNYFLEMWRVMFFFIHVSLLTIIFFAINQRIDIRRYDMPEDFLIYPYMVTTFVSSLFLLEYEGKLQALALLPHSLVALVGLWLAAIVVIVYEEKFILTSTRVGLKGRMRIFLSAVLFYFILSPLL